MNSSSLSDSNFSRESSTDRSASSRRLSTFTHVGKDKGKGEHQPWLHHRALVWAFPGYQHRFLILSQIRHIGPVLRTVFIFKRSVR